MTSAPPGFRTVGPIYLNDETKEKFVDVCKAENKTMEKKLKELIMSAILKVFPDYTVPLDEAKDDK